MFSPSCAPAVCNSKREPNIRESPLWETSGLSLAAVRLHLSWGRLRSSENAAYRRGVAILKPSAGLGFPPYGRRLACPWRRWGCVSLGDVSGAAKTQYDFERSLNLSLLACLGFRPMGDICVVCDVWCVVCGVWFVVCGEWCECGFLAPAVLLSKRGTNI